MTSAHGNGGHDCSEEVISAQHTAASHSALSATYRQPCVFVKPSPLVIPQQNNQFEKGRSGSALDQNRGRVNLHESSSCCSDASFSSRSWPERPKTAQRSDVSPMVTNLPSPAFRCLFSSDDNIMGFKQPALEHNVNWSGLLQANTSSSYPTEQSPHRKDIEQWLNKMESQVVSRATSASHTPAGTPRLTTAGCAGHADGPRTPVADLPAPAFVLMGLLSS